MKTTIPILLAALVLCGCASTTKNPLMTGNPKDWRGHPTADLIAACGQPAHIFNQSDGEIWQYVNERDAIVPKGSHMAFNMRGFSDGYGSANGAAGGFESHDQYTAHFKRTDNFEIKDGIIKRWYGEIDQNGQIIWKGH
jgi:hypothetical protein